MWLAALVALVVEGSSDCPRPQEVSTQLAALAGSTAGDGRVILTRDQQALDLRLMGTDEGLLAERRLEAAGASCQELAAAAGLVVAAWLARLPSPPVSLPAEAAPPPPGPGAMVQLQAGGLGLLTSGPSTGGVTVDASYTAPARGLSLGAGLALIALRRQELGGGRAASWTRLPLWISGGYAVTRGWLRFEAHLDLATGLLLAQGQGFAENRSVQALTLGVGGGVRLSAARGRWGPWVGLTGLTWPRREALSGVETRALPRLEAMLSAGIFHRLL